MKIFNLAGKVNFIDENNVLVGFDYESSCCEVFGYFLSRTPPTTLDPADVLQESDEAFAGFVFDTEFKESVAFVKPDDADTVVFRLTRGDETIFLTLHNTHNGYYGHGFDMTLDGARLHSGCL
jgi:hypothetical protein